MSSIDDLSKWQESAMPGQRFIYYTGFIAADASRDAEVVREHAASLYLTGRYELAQARRDAGVFDYYIIKRAEKDPQHRQWMRDGMHHDYHKPSGNQNIMRHRWSPA